ncbi:hypothetical protein HPB48_006129 [Haemaphysalis longicornis]|uniref:Uncharacterized protein n=1 Tax=Haemaphysalis longicornis TaxID=44386 RepID=A0A9J6GR68_HAELO|nr:hypothetical protein HPB48_006129 [Haemaphysalis longicornis]
MGTFFIPPKVLIDLVKGDRTETLRIELTSGTLSNLLVRYSTNKKSPISGRSPFLTCKCIENIPVKTNAKKMPSRELLVELIRKKNESARLLKEGMIANSVITVTPHRALNIVQGAIFGREILAQTDADFLDGMKDEGVVSIHGFVITRDGALITTRHILVAFASRTLPETMKAVFINCRVRACFPNSKR